MSKKRSRVSVFFAIEVSIKISKILSSVTISEVSRQARESFCARLKGRNRVINSDVITICFSFSFYFVSVSSVSEYSVSGFFCNFCFVLVILKGIFFILMKQVKLQVSNVSTVVSGEFQFIVSVLLIISICVEFVISVNISSERISIGSIRMSSVNSRLVSIFVNGFSVFSSERVKKKRNRVRRQIRVIRSSSFVKGETVINSGKVIVSISMLLINIYGIRRNIRFEDVGVIFWRLNSLWISR